MTNVSTDPPVPSQRTPTRWTQNVVEKAPTRRSKPATPSGAKPAAKTASKAGVKAAAKPAAKTAGKTTTVPKSRSPKAAPAKAAGVQVEPAPSALESAILLVLSLVWLGTTLRLADSLLVANGDDASQLASAVSLVLPTVVYAALLAGACVGLVSGRLRLARAEATGRPAVIRRALVGAGSAAILGLILVLLILGRYSGGSSLVVLASTVGVAALLGGAGAALPRPVLAAGVTGTIELFLIGFVVNLFQAPLKSGLGASSDPTSQLHAASWLAALTALVQGIAAGLTAYAYLRRRASALRWPAFALAGAVPGLILLVGVGLSLLGGSSLSSLADQLSDADRVVRDVVSGADLNQALTVAFVGTIVAMLAIGRTLRRPPDEDDDF